MIRKILCQTRREDTTEASAAIAESFGAVDRVNQVLDFPSSTSNAKMLTAYPEMAWLAGAVNATPEGLSAGNKEASLSEQLFNEKHIEFDRTAVGIMMLKWVLKGEYEAFTECQGDAVKLSRESFDELRRYTQNILPDAEAIDAMVTYMVINDLGKIQSVVADVQYSFNITNVDHDKILLAALEQNPEIAPSFQRLSPHYKNLIVGGLKPNLT